jgi:hypothetical protein
MASKDGHFLRCIASKLVEFDAICCAEAPAMLFPFDPNFNASLKPLNLSQCQMMWINQKIYYSAIHLFFAISFVQYCGLPSFNFNFLLTYLYIYITIRVAAVEGEAYLPSASYAPEVLTSPEVAVIDEPFAPPLRIQRA